MAISFIAQANAGTDGFYDVTVSKPTGTADGDIMFAMISHEGNATVPSGWTVLVDDGAVFFDIAYKIAGASEPSSYTWEYDTSYSGGGQNVFGVIATYRPDYIDESSPFYDQAISVTVGDTTTPTAGSLDIPFNDCSLVWICMSLDSTSLSVTEPSVPASFTEDFEVDNGDDYVTVEAAHLEWSSNGNTGSIAGSLSAASYRTAALVFAINSVHDYDAGTGQMASVTIPASGSWALSRAFPDGAGQSAAVSTPSGSWIQYIPVPFEAGAGQSASILTGSGTWTKTWFYASGSGQSAVVTIPASGYWTYPKPAVSIDPTTWHDKQLNIHSIGADYGLDGVTVELCDNSDYSLAATKTAQTILYHDDEIITMLIDTTGFVDGDTAYLFVTNKYGSRSLYKEIDIIDYDAPDLPNRYRLDAVHFIKDTFAMYYCSKFGDDRHGNFVWERYNHDKDLILGDGADTDTFPANTEVSEGKDYYTFDGVDDHFSNWPSAPTAHTTIIGYSVSPYTVPAYMVANDDTIKDLLTTAGGFTGRLYNIAIYPWRMSALEISYVTSRMLRLV